MTTDSLRHGGGFLRGSPRRTLGVFFFSITVQKSTHTSFEFRLQSARKPRKPKIIGRETNVSIAPSGLFGRRRRRRAIHRNYLGPRTIGHCVPRWGEGRSNRGGGSGGGEPGVGPDINHFHVKSSKRTRAGGRAYVYDAHILVRVACVTRPRANRVDKRLARSTENWRHVRRKTITRDARSECPPPLPTGQDKSQLPDARRFRSRSAPILPFRRAERKE